MSIALSRYWNSRPDPLDWKRSRPSGPREWQQACATFLAPATRAGIDALGDLRGRRVLELGCGQGHGAFHLADRGADVVGLDVSDRRCAAAAAALAGRETGGRAEFCSATAERLPFAAGSFDAVFARDVLMYSDPEQVARECERVLAPGGRLVFVESLDGNALLRLYRRWTSPPDYRELTHHLSWRRLCALDVPLRQLSVLPYYLLSQAAFGVLFFARSVKLHRGLLRLLGPIDAMLLRRWPGLARLAWRGTAVYSKAEAGDVC